MDAQNIFQANRRATKRLTALTAEISERDLMQSLPNGWPVFVALAHIAFWDRRVIHILETSKDGKWNVPPLDVQLNDILAPILRAIPPKDAAALAVQTAGTLDRMLEECSVESLDALQNLNPRFVNRSLHRNNHLDSMESILKKSKGGGR